MELPYQDGGGIKACQEAARDIYHSIPPTERFLPIFFCIGGVMEWIMINVRIGKETFYDVYRRKQSERAYQKRITEDLPREPVAK